MNPWWMAWVHWGLGFYTGWLIHGIYSRRKLQQEKKHGA